MPARFAPTLAPWRPAPGPRAARSRCRALAADMIPERRRYRLKNKLLGPPLVTEQLELGAPGPPDRPRRAGPGLHLLVGLRHRGDADPDGARTSGWPPSPWSCPITLAILGVLFFVTLSYLEVIQFYTKAGGAYVVARDNFGPKVAQIAAVALLIDYTVTVAVQTAAGTAALTSAVPAWPTPSTPWPSPSASCSLLLYGNLRGIREAGKFFAFPTYFFMSSLAVGDRRRATSRRRSATCTTSRSRPTTRSSGGTLGTPGHGLLDGPGLHHAAALLRQRRLVADRPRGHLQRGQQFPPARVDARPPDPGRHELDPGLPGARGDHAAGPLDPRRPLRLGLAHRRVPGGPGRLRQLGAARLLHRPARHRAHPLHRRQHQLQRLPVPGQLRGRRPLPAPPADPARPPAGLLQRDPGAHRRLGRAAPGLPGPGRRPGRRSTPSASSPASPWPAPAW